MLVFVHQFWNKFRCEGNQTSLKECNEVKLKKKPQKDEHQYFLIDSSQRRFAVRNGKNKSQPRNWFGQQRTSEGYERYQIGPK